MSKEPNRVRPIWTLIPAVLLIILIGAKLQRVQEERARDVQQKVQTAVKTELKKVHEIKTASAPNATATASKDTSDSTRAKSPAVIPKAKGADDTPSPAGAELSQESAKFSNILAEIQKERQQIEKALQEARVNGADDRVVALERERDSLLQVLNRTEDRPDTARQTLSQTADTPDTTSVDPTQRMIDSLRKGKPGKDILRDIQKED